MDFKFIFYILPLLFVEAISHPGEIQIIEQEKNNVNGSRDLAAKEYLSPNLVGLHNIAITYLPITINYLNIIEAYRERVNGVRYELAVNATNEDNKEIICYLVVQEKPWQLTVWNEKQRELIYSNCSSVDSNSVYNQSAIDNKYKTNTLFNNQNTDLSYDQLSQLESQILEPKNKLKNQTFSKNNVDTNGYQEKKTSDIIDEINEEEIFKIVVTEPYETSTVTNTQESSQVTEAQETLQVTEAQESLQVTEAGQSSSVTVAQESSNGDSSLSEESKYFLDNFFSFYNFGSNEDAGKNENLKDQVDLQNTQHAIDNSDGKSFQNTQSETFDNMSNSRMKRSISKKHVSAKAERLFEKFQTKYSKNYSGSLEREMRYKIFESNLIKINQLNKMEQGTAKYGITEFSDMTSTEYHMRTGLLIHNNENKISNSIAEIPDYKLPKEFDWRKKGVVSEVKNQGNCGSCWAFSVTGNIESLNAIKTGQLKELSEQELLDCDTTDSACGGGLMDNAYKAIESIGGLETETEYPYLAHKEKCEFNKSMSVVQIRGGIDLPKNETAMALWLMANGPISIGINANAMQFYKGGISHPWSLLCRHSGIDHGVLIVGFGVSEYPNFNKTLPYWIVKNSWGPDWGEQGYYRVFRGDNTCGINSMASSAIL